MRPKWKSPIYILRTRLGKRIEIDVTTSISAALPPHKVIQDEVIPYLKRRGNVRTILDFGAGALRHTIPLLRAGFEVCAVEFDETFRRPVCSKALKKVTRNSNFTKLIWPRDFIRDRRKFDAALLSFVLQTMPIHSERKQVLKYIYKKLRTDSCLIYLSRYGQVVKSMKNYRVKDGFYMWPKRTRHSFYREFTTEETHLLMESFKFNRLRSLSNRGTEQVIVYGKGDCTWIR